MAMECDICTELFDGAERVPKSLPCGHTACLQCLGLLPDSSCPTCRRDFTGPPDGLPTNFTVLQFLEGRRLDSTPRCWCLDCRTAPSPQCWEDHDVLPVKRALRRLLQGALPLAAEQLRGLQDQCRDKQALPALTLLTGESWDVSLRGGGRELTGTLRNTEEPLTKALWLLLAERAALTEDRVGPVLSAARPTHSPPPTSAPATSAAAPPPAAAPSAAGPTRGPPPAAAPSAARPTRSPPPTAAPATSVAAPPPPAAPPAGGPDGGPPPAEAWPAREMNVGRVFWGWSGPEGVQQKKAAALRDAPGVTRLVDVKCKSDPAWSLELLQRAAPSVEDLSVHNPGEAHLLAVHAMPRLRRLHVTGSPAAPATVLPALPPGHAGLQWLMACDVPRATLQSLLQAHIRTLEELHLVVRTVEDVGWLDGWPWSWDDLDSLALLWSLRSLRRLVLKRVGHGTSQCDKQCFQVKRLLREVLVLCDECDRSD